MHPEVQEPKPGDCPKCGMALEPMIPPAAAVTYTCPMHPEIVSDRPGDCPFCGMALEPVTVASAEEVNPELVDMRRRFWVSLVLSVPVALLAMGDYLGLGGITGLVPKAAHVWVEFAFATPVVLWGGWPFFVRCFMSFVRRSLNMFTLIGIGTGVAYAYSLIGAVWPGIFPESFRENGAVPVYFEAAAIIITLVLLGQVLELKARSQTSNAIKALLGLAPKTARRLRPDGTDEDVPLEQVQPGDRLRVRPGEKVAVEQASTIAFRKPPSPGSKMPAGDGQGAAAGAEQLIAFDRFIHPSSHSAHQLVKSLPRLRQPACSRRP